jgi:hypothetical protein
VVVRVPTTAALLAGWPELRDSGLGLTLIGRCDRWTVGLGSEGGIKATDRHEQRRWTEP